MKGGAKIAMSLADMLNNWSDKVYKQEAMTVKKNAYESGLAYGQQAQQTKGGALYGRAGEEAEYGREKEPFELRGGTTVYDQAFNKGARLAYQAAVQLDMREAITKYEIEHPADPHLFDALASTYRSTILGEISDPETLAFATHKVDEYILDSRTRILKAETAEDRAQQFATVQEHLKAANRDVGLAIEMGDDAMALNRAVLREAIVNRAVEAMLIKESAVPELINKMREDDAVAIWVRDYRKDLEAGNGDAAYDAFVERGLKEQKYTAFGDVIVEGGMTADLHERIRKNLWEEKGRFNTQQAQDNKAAATDLKMRKKAFERARDDAIKVLNDGGTYPDFDNLIENLQMLAPEDPVWAYDQQVKIEEAQWGSQIAGYFKTLNLEGAESQQDFLIQLKQGLPVEHQLTKLYYGDDTTVVPQSWQIGLIDRLEKKHDATWAAINSGNGLEQAVEDGVPDVKIDQLTGNSLDDFLGFVESRYENAKRAATHWGIDVSKVSPFSPNEISQVQTMWEESMSMDDKLTFLRGIVGGMGKDAEVFLKRFDKDKHTSLGWAGAFAQSGNWGLAEELIRGAEMPPEMAAAYMPGADKLNDAVFLAMGDAFEAAPDFDVAQDVLKAATNLYKWRSFGAKDQDNARANIVNQPRLNKVLTDLTGGFVTLRWDESVAGGRDFTYNIIAPEPNMNRGNTEKWLKSITAEEIIAQGGTLELDPDGGVLTPPDLVARLLNEGGLKLVSIFEGPGQPVKYYLQWHNQAYISAADGGSAFKLEHRKDIAQPDGGTKSYTLAFDARGWFQGGVPTEHIKKLKREEHDPSVVPLVETLEEGSAEKTHLETAIVKEQVKINTAGGDIKEQTGADIKDLYVPDAALEPTEDLKKQALEVVEKLNAEQQAKYFWLRSEGATHTQSMEGALTDLEKAISVNK